MKIEIYGRKVPYCQYCEGAKNFLDIKNLPYDFLDITENPENRTIMFQRAPVGITTVPQIFIDSNYVGGFKQLQEYFTDK